MVSNTLGTRSVACKTFLSWCSDSRWGSRHEIIRGFRKLSRCWTDRLCQVSRHQSVQTNCRIIKVYHGAVVKSSRQLLMFLLLRTAADADVEIMPRQWWLATVLVGERTFSKMGIIKSVGYLFNDGTVTPEYVVVDEHWTRCSTCNWLWCRPWQFYSHESSQGFRPETEGLAT